MAHKIGARRKRHGHTFSGGAKVTTPAYSSWLQMRRRCTEVRHHAYASYGGRGITVCDRWKDSFENFLADMPPHPGKGYSLDRIDNNGNYEPGNCRWATKKEQSRNSRWNCIVSFNGRSQPLSAWVEELNLPYHTIWQRLRRGQDPVTALTKPIQAYRKKVVKVTNG